MITDKPGDELIAQFEDATLASFHHADLARAGTPQSWEEFAASNPDLLSRKDSVLNKYYRAETLTSDLAKRTFLFPDKLKP